MLRQSLVFVFPPILPSNIFLHFSNLLFHSINYYNILNTRCFPFGFLCLRLYISFGCVSLVFVFHPTMVLTKQGVAYPPPRFIFTCHNNLLSKQEILKNCSNLRSISNSLLAVWWWWEAVWAQYTPLLILPNLPPRLTAPSHQKRKKDWQRVKLKAKRRSHFGRPSQEPQGNCRHFL